LVVKVSTTYFGRRLALRRNETYEHAAQRIPPMSPAPDRRTHPRVILKTEVDCICEDKHLRGRRAYDISEGGMRLELVELPVRTPVKVVLPIPQPHGDKSLVCLLDGQVAWRRLNATGVRFSNKEGAAIGLVRQYVRQMTADLNREGAPKN
jgi:hypothetical protein